MSAVADYLAEQIYAAGARRVYGLPGGENVVALDAMRRRGLDFVLVRNESSACFMAAAEARLTGKLGVALTTLGPGATNACAGLAHAYLDRAPILLITAASDPADSGRHTHQVLDLQALFSPITKSSVELSRQNAAGAIREAIVLTRRGRPGPVHLSLHNRIAGQPIVESAPPREPVIYPPLAKSQLKAALELLAGKGRPIIVVGLGLEPDAPYAQLRQLAECLNAPLIDTPKSKGALPADHGLFAGTLGLTRHDPVYELLDEADCIIAIGFDVVELVKPWDYAKPLLWIANWTNADPRIEADLELVGDIGGILDGLRDIKSASQSGWGAPRVARFRQDQARIKRPRPEPGRILPQTFLESLRAKTPADVIISTDVGSHKIFAALNWGALQPNRYLVSNGLSAMGFGLCSAIAAAMVTGQATVCITGDAGLAMVMGELGLLAELGLPVLVCVMNDAALDLIRSAQQRQGHAAFGTEFTNPDFAYIARAFGLDYYKVAAQAELELALQAGLAARAPALIDVMVDPISYPTTAPPAS